MDKRLVDLEEQQGADRIRLSSLVSGDFRQGGTEEFTIRYMPTEIRLKIAGKTLLITDEGKEDETDADSFDIEAWIDSNSDYMKWGLVRAVRTGGPIHYSNPPAQSKEGRWGGG